jgi:hypothetical protein
MVRFEPTVVGLIGDPFRDEKMGGDLTTNCLLQVSK